jgi:hypothetical protein
MLEMLSTVVVRGRFKPSTDFIVMGGALTGLAQETTVSSFNITPMGVKGSWRVWVTTSLPSVSRLSRKCESLDISQPSGPSWPVMGYLYLFTFYITIILKKNFIM